MKNAFISIFAVSLIFGPIGWLLDLWLCPGYTQSILHWIQLAAISSTAGLSAAAFCDFIRDRKCSKN